MKKIYFFTLFCLMLVFAQAQTTLISPTGDGGFENGATPAANGWTAVNSSTDAWVVGAAPVVSAGANCGYISANAGTAWSYSQISTTQHLFKNVTIPMGEGASTLTFKWKVGGEGTTTSDWDNMKIFIVPATITPVANTALAVGFQISGPGAVSGMYKLSSASYNTETINIANLQPGSSYRLVFSWKSDGSTIANPPAAIDEVSFVSKVPTSINASALGGLWNSPATWVGGVVPTNIDNVVIDNNAIVTVNQIVTIRDLTIGGVAAGTLQWTDVNNAFTANGNTLVNPNGKLNLFTSPLVTAPTPNGINFNAGGNFTNNGSVFAANVSTTHGALLFNNPFSSPTLSGSGTFVGGIISQLWFQTLGNSVINTTNNITCRIFAHTAGNLNTNGLLSINNTVQVYGQPLNQQVYQVAVTAMGTGYNTANPPTITIPPPTGAGVQATATANIDNVTGTLRSITVTNPGDGYRTSIAVTLAGGSGTGAAATAVVNWGTPGNTASNTQKNGNATITGGIANIKSDQAVGGITTSNGGIGYTTAPDVGFALPVGALNLVTNGGSGYIVAPSVSFMGGTRLAGGTDPNFTITVADGKVVSVIAISGGSLWQVPPNIVINGVGIGATCAYPTGCLATATAVISNGMVSNFNIINGGFGYQTTAAPAVGLVGGGFTTAATAPSCRIGVYNLNVSNFVPGNVNPLTFSAEDGLIPATRRIGQLVISNPGINFTGDIELYSVTPLTLTSGVLNMNGGAANLNFTNPGYVGIAGTATANVNGIVSLASPGGSQTRTFPFDAPVTVVVGSGSLATGSSITKITANRTIAPTGTSMPAGNAIGTRAYRIQTLPGQVYGTAPTINLNYNTTDGLFSENASLFIGQAATLSGSWTNRSVAAAPGTLPTTGSRTTGTVAPTLIVPTNDDYYAWINTLPLITSANSGDWNIGGTWSTMAVPTCTDNVFILNTHNVNVNSAGNVGKNVTINTGATLTATTGDLTIGCTLNNNSLTSNGTLTVNGGTLNVNGSLAISNGSTFNQTAGEVIVDGNAAGVVVNSVASGTNIVSFGTSGATTVLNFTGGKITIVDPHTATALPGGTSNGHTFAYWGNGYKAGLGHSLQFGNGISTDAGGAAGGYSYNTFPGAGYFIAGNIIIDAPTGTNRNITPFYSVGVEGDFTITKGEYLSSNTQNIIAGNLTVNSPGIFTNTTTLTMAKWGTSLTTAGTFVASPNAQTISGTGTFRNLATAPTAELTNFIVNNSNATGVTLSVPLRLSAGLTLTAGKINTTLTNLLTLGFNATNPGGTLTYTAGQIAGPFRRWLTTNTGNRLFPIGDGVLYKPANINFTTAPTTAGTLTAVWVPGMVTIDGLPLTETNVTPSTISMVADGIWDITANTLAGGIYTGTFTHNGAAGILAFAQATLLKRDNAASNWTNPNTHIATIGSNAAPTASRSGLVGFSQFGIGGGTGTLNLANSSFTANKNGNGAAISWLNSSIGATKFEVLKSTDGINYITISTSYVVASQVRYNATDPQLTIGANYYKLKTTHTDGTIKFSQVVIIYNQVKGFQIASMIPTLVTNNTLISIATDKAKQATLIVVDIQGKIITRIQVDLQAGTKDVLLDVANFKAGVYQLYAVAKDGKTNLVRFIKQ